MRSLTPLVLGSAALLAPALLAQDSVSKTGSDAVDAFSAGEQLNTYVVDLTPISTSWGTAFGVAPIAKGSLYDPAFSTGFINSQAASATGLTGVGTPFNSYQRWTGQGLGVNNNSQLNDPGTPINTSGLTTTQLGFAFSEGSTGSEAIVTATVNYDPANPARLYVARIPAAINGTLLGTTSSNFGFGAVDANGNISARADDFGLTGGNQVNGNNTFRVDALARNTNVLNVIGGSGGSDAGATTFLVTGSGTTHNVPGQIPSDIAGRPVYIGSNFNAEYVYENVAGSTTTTTAHKSTSDHRGSVHFSPAVIFPGSIGTATLLGNDGQTRSMLLWGVDANGNVSGTQTLVPPTTVTDLPSSTTWPASGSIGQFNSHLSQTAFEGGTGQVAVGRDVNGNALVATMIQDDGTLTGPTNPVGAILVARFDPASPGSVTWTTAAYNNGLTGKAITDGAGGNAIGQCVGLNQVTGGSAAGNVDGPSFSVPVIDAAGNCWFIAAVELFGGGGSDFDTALLRAVYNPGTGGYELELVLQLGQVLAGQNSGTNYQIGFMPIADNNSISSSTMFSGNGVQTAFNNMDPSTLDTCDPRTTGGVVLHASIIYDVNGDGNFENPTQVTTVDQQYNVLLYVGHNGDTTSNCDGSGSGPVNYCTAKASSSGCLATMTTSNPNALPVSGAGGYSAIVEGAQALRPGIFFTSTTAPAAISFQGGVLCFTPPLKRSTILFTGGTSNQCNGSFFRVINDGNLLPPNGTGFDAGPGNTSFIQAWHRDPALMDGFDTALSDAIQVDWL